ncbi:MAG: acetolactate synthase small subunit, partial [Spirochaetales bacterium]|nr:acetolactate synthase small subunit [Spirochaetales bacterium]
MNHVISLLVENNSGVLARISGLLSGRGYNVESFSAGLTTDPTITRLTIVCQGDDTIIDQIKKQLNKLIEVIKVTDLTNKSA